LPEQGSQQMHEHTPYRPPSLAVIVDPYSSGAQLAPAFVKRGVPVAAVLTAKTPPAVYASSYRPGDFKQIIIADGDLAGLAQQVAALGPCCVLAGCESGVELAEQLAPLVVPTMANVAELAKARRHKGHMAAAVTAAGLPSIRQICSSNAEQVADWIASSGLTGRDLVIKPPKSASTDGVTLVPHGAGWHEVFDSMLGSSNRLGLVNDVLVVQEFAEGTEYVVDTFSHDGVHAVTDVCRYDKVHNGGFMAIYDTMEWLSPDHPAVPGLVGYARAVLDAVGVRFGAAHIEIMQTADGPRLIEIGARPHGGGHPRFCLLATGDSQVERTARYFAGDRDIPSSYQLLTHTLVVFHMARAAGHVGDIARLDEIEALPTHYESVHNFAAGDRIRTTTDLFGSLDLGFVVLNGVHRSQIWRDYEKIRAAEADMFVYDQKETAAVLEAGS
jgi:ATP-grasp domain-containing protein